MDWTTFLSGCGLQATTLPGGHGNPTHKWRGRMALQLPQGQLSRRYSPRTALLACSTEYGAHNRREAVPSTGRRGSTRVAIHRLPGRERSNDGTIGSRQKSTANCRHNDAKVTPTTEKIKELGTAAKIEKSWHCSLKARVAGHRSPIAY